MMMVDMECPTCGHFHEDELIRAGNEHPRCRACSELLVKLPVAPAVHADGIPGGIMIRNGICNADGSPRRYDSKSEIRLATKQAGLINRVQHEPSKGSDKNNQHNTQRFV